MDVVFAIILGVLALWVVILFAILLPLGMARRRNRDGLAWVLVSLIGSPFLAIILLLLLGDRED